ncbi:MAG TPA: exopolysaccharide biosynthesis polyprenyl glycosylphosphotransferase [Lacunisphaera sp.]|nr:exopolysaccharide biosynthesis polyprenyl glycosylphosphotransferase [Lacunisphaera sp.]
MAALLMLGYHNVFPYIYFAEISEPNILPFIVCVVGGMVVSIHYLHVVGPRFYRLSWLDSAWLTTRQTIVVALAVFAFMFALKNREISRVFVVTYLALLWVLLLFVNLGLPRFLCRLFFERDRRIPTLFIGSPEGMGDLKHWLAAKEMLGLYPVGFLADQEPPVSGSAPSFLGALTSLPRILAEGRVVQVIVLELPRQTIEARFIIETCQDYGCRLLIYSNLAERLRHPLVTVTEEGHQFHTLQEEPLEDPLNRVLKRSFDLALSLPVVMFLLPPLMALVWVMQRFQAPGRLFFVQERTGHAQRSFKIIKFRSMYEMDQSAEQEAQQAKRDDGRIYPFGRLLRSTSLDEFPQFINVLIGEMSLVGPRPHPVNLDRQFSDLMKGYRTRFFVKPGITGLAQCNGLRGEITDPQLLEHRIKLDLAYITEWSFWLDVLITVKTARHLVFPPKSAY